MCEHNSSCLLTKFSIINSLISNNTFCFINGKRVFVCSIYHKIMIRKKKGIDVDKYLLN